MEHAKHYVSAALDNSFGNMVIDPLVVSRTIYSNKFAGYLATNFIRNQASVIETYSSWIQPTVFSTQPRSQLAIWTGINGSNPPPDGSVIQAGTIALTSKPPVYYFFYEDYPQPVHVLTNTIQPNPGDNIYVDVTYITTTQRANYFIEDTTTQQYLSLYDNAPYYDASGYAAYVMEISGSPLPPSLNIPFTGCNLVWYKWLTGGNPGEGPLGSFDNLQQIMTDTGTITGTVEVNTTFLGPDLQSFSLLRGPQ